MPITTVNLTFDLADLLAVDFDTRRTKVWIETNVVDSSGRPAPLVDTDGQQVRFGPATAAVGTDGTGSFVGLIATNSADVMPTGFLYQVHVDYPRRTPRNDRETWDSGWFALTATSDLALVADVPNAPVIVTQDSALAAVIADPGSDTTAALLATYGRKRSLDVRDFGAVCDGVTDDTTAIQAAITAAGAYGSVELPPLSMKITAPLVLQDGTELRGVGTKATRLMCSTDTAIITTTGGQGQSIRNLKIWSTYTGARTTYDIDISTPTKVVIEDVEIDLPSTKTGLGGIRLLGNGGGAGNEFMVQMSRVWIRYGTLLIDGVTDGHFSDGFVWAADDAAAAIHLKAISDGWTFSGVDVVPSDGAGTGYLIESTNHTKLLGGYIDGSYVTNLTGYGIVANSAGRLFIAGYNFYYCGRTAIKLNNTNGCVVTGAGFYRNNKTNGSYPDIDLVNSNYNTFLGLTHSQPDNHANKGAIYREDATSVGNLYDASTLETAAGNNYASPVAVVNAATLGRRNRPASSFPRPSGVSEQVIPAASVIGIPAVTGWAAANTAIFQRVTITEGGVYRYANFRVGTGSGNMQAALVRLSGAGYVNYDRVLDSGVVACTAGNKALDMTSAYVAPGEYAIALWFDNTTATVSRTTDTAVQAMRLTASVASLATGVPSSGTLSWGSTGNYIGGLSLSQTTT